MPLTTKRTSLLAGGCALLLAGAVAAAPSALASPSQGYISGLSTVTDDWGDEGPLSYGAQSYAVGLWQQVLRAEGLIGPNDVDCIFGSQTKAATRAFQIRYHLSSTDGVVGKETFSRADDNLHDNGGAVVYYTNTTVDIGVWTRRGTTGEYYLDGGQPATYAWHSGACVGVD